MINSINFYKVNFKYFLKFKFFFLFRVYKKNIGYLWVFCLSGTKVELCLSQINFTIFFFHQGFFYILPTPGVFFTSLLTSLKHCFFWETFSGNFCETIWTNFEFCFKQMIDSFENIRKCSIFLFLYSLWQRVEMGSGVLNWRIRLVLYYNDLMRCIVIFIKTAALKHKPLRTTSTQYTTLRCSSQ